MAVNTKQAGDCGYVCFYRGKRCEVYAPSTSAAQQLAAKHFKAKKAYDVSVVLAELPDASQVTHSTAAI
jgi:hypothetical protein